MRLSHPSARLQECLEELYRRFNHREWVDPDPLQFLYSYKDKEDREVAALIAATLAYGRVAQILRSVSFVLEVLGPSPRQYLLSTPMEKLRSDLEGFKHRFTTHEEMALLLGAVAGAIRRHGTLNQCFLTHHRPEEPDVSTALNGFAMELHRLAGGGPNSLLPLPHRGSACKRLHLFLRWMVRCDEVDPGGWIGVKPSQLIVPMDTHMNRVCHLLGFTRRRNPDLRSAKEATESFRRLCPADPVKYDFCLTRAGIRGDWDMAAFFDECLFGTAGSK
jgi:uncharacterized protein (TIGR02757 family)